MSSYTIARLVITLFNFYSFLVLVYCFLTWIPMRRDGWLYDIAMVLDGIVGPYLNLFRRFIPPLGGIDFSPVLAILVLNMLENLILRLL